MSPAHPAYSASLACPGYLDQRDQKETTALWVEKVRQAMWVVQVGARLQIAAPRDHRDPRDPVGLSAKEENRVRRGVRGRKEVLGRGGTWARGATLE